MLTERTFIIQLFTLSFLRSKHVFKYPGLICINPLLHRRRQHADKEILDRDRKSAL